MTCRDCGYPLGVEQTLKAHDVDTRIHQCACGSRWLSESRIVRRLQPAQIRGTSKVRPPDKAPANPPESSGGDRGGVPEIPVSDPDSGPISVDPPIRPRARSNRKAETPAFRAFYGAYPRKEKRPAALRAWLAQGCEPIADTVMAGLARWQPEFARRKAKDPSTVPHPASWLNGWQWEDEPPAVAVTPIRRTDPAIRAREEAEDAALERRAELAFGRTL